MLWGKYVGSILSIQRQGNTPWLYPPLTAAGVNGSHCLCKVCDSGERAATDGLITGSNECLGKYMGVEGMILLPKQYVYFFQGKKALEPLLKIIKVNRLG